MKSKLFVIVMLAFVLSACGAAPTPEPTVTAIPPTVVPPTATPAGLNWPEFSSDTGKFAVLLPQTPTEEVQTASSASGEITVHMYIVEDVGTAYAVMYNDYPVDLGMASLDEAGVNDVLDGSRDGALDGVSGEIVNESSIKIGDYIGREISYTIPSSVIPDSGVGYLRLYLVGDRLYQVMAIGPASSIDANKVDLFFESFQLMP
ncbi:MAG: hypothetical protein L3J16_08140 [Anaerolineales bacterium]|nr:hypothetical protein [Anaerolineales bacterium]